MPRAADLALPKLPDDSGDVGADPPVMLVMKEEMPLVRLPRPGRLLRGEFGDDPLDDMDDVVELLGESVDSGLIGARTSTGGT